MKKFIQCGLVFFGILMSTNAFAQSYGAGVGVGVSSTGFSAGANLGQSNTFDSSRLAAQPAGGYVAQPSTPAAEGAVAGGEGCCQQADQPVGDCYCLYCHYEPCYYNDWKCIDVPQVYKKKCCRMVPKYYEVQRCRYVPQYYCETCCKYEPEYYCVDECRNCKQWICEKKCQYVPRYYYKHTCQQQQACQPTCAPAPAQSACCPR